MSTDVFTLDCEALPGLRLSGFKGTEILSRPFEFDLFFTVPVGTDVRSAVGARATLTADRDDGRGPICWHGILAGVRLLHETAEHALYRTLLVPQLWFLGQYVRSFAHTKKKIDAFVADTLTDGGLTGGGFEFKINAGAYPQEEFVCQYRESHLDFVHRWCEREGLYYYFEHPEGAGASEKVVFADDKGHHSPLFGEGHVRYSPTAGHDGSAGECLRELSADYRLLPASVLVTDYNYANPAAPVAGEKPVLSGGRGKIREYGYRVFTEGEAKRLAQVKAHSIACRELVLTASGTPLGLRAGYTFQLDDAPTDLPSKYLAIEVRHAGLVTGAPTLVQRYTGLDASETYRVDVTAIPASVQYRAPQSTAWPRIYGFENGTVDGPAESQYAQLDDQGRYLVRFKFDASDLPDGSTSTYLRMMQPHGGTTEGFHFPLRKGTEVMVSFQGGDPDRPLIAGVVPNAVQPSNITSRNHTQNVLRSGGGNFMIMDDTAGAECIDMGTPGAKTYLYMGEPDPEPGFIGPPERRPPSVVPIPPTDPTKKDNTAAMSFSYWVATEQSAGFQVGGDWWQGVTGSLFLDVGSLARIRYQADHTLIVLGPSEEFYQSSRSTTISGAYKQEVKDGLTQVIAPGGTQTVHGNWTQIVSANKSGVYGNWSAMVGGSWRVSTGGAIAFTSGSTISMTAPSAISMNAPEITQNTGRFYETKETAFAVCGLDYTFAMNSLAFAPIAVSLGTLKVDLFGYKMENHTLDITSAAVEVAQRAYRGIKGAIFDGKSGVSVQTSGLHVSK